MKKYLILFVFMIICASFNAQALVQQSASKALSYNNVYSPKLQIKKIEKEPTVKEEVKEVAPEQKVIDMGNGVTKNISLIKGQEVVINIFEKKGQVWKVTYDSSTVSMLSNKVSGNNRVITFRQKTTKSNTIFFDCIDEDGKIVQNKAVYIKVN